MSGEELAPASADQGGVAEVQSRKRELSSEEDGEAGVNGSLTDLLDQPKVEKRQLPKRTRRTPSPSSVSRFATGSVDDKGKPHEEEVSLQSPTTPSPAAGLQGRQSRSSTGAKKQRQAAEEKEKEAGQTAASSPGAEPLGELREVIYLLKGKYISCEGEDGIWEGYISSDLEGFSEDSKFSYRPTYKNLLNTSSEKYHELCGVCKQDDPENFIFCDLCDTGAHCQCIGLQAVPKGKWFCGRCQNAMDTYGPLPPSREWKGFFELEGPPLSPPDGGEVKKNFVRIQEQFRLDFEYYDAPKPVSGKRKKQSKDKIVEFASAKGYGQNKFGFFDLTGSLYCQGRTIYLDCQKVYRPKKRKLGGAGKVNSNLAKAPSAGALLVGGQDLFRATPPPDAQSPTPQPISAAAAASAGPNSALRRTSISHLLCAANAKPNLSPGGAFMEETGADHTVCRLELQRVEAEKAKLLAANKQLQLEVERLTAALRATGAVIPAFSSNDRVEKDFTRGSSRREGLQRKAATVQQEEKPFSALPPETPSSHRVLVLTDLDCYFHATPKGVVETQGRLTGLWSALFQSKLRSRLSWLSDIPRVPLEMLMIVHEPSYVLKVLEMTQSLSTEAVHFETGNAVKKEQDVLEGDTFVSCNPGGGSYPAALKAAGSVCKAVDEIFKPGASFERSFCCIRPPGHHAGRAGVPKGALGADIKAGQGFCLLNNVAIGALYAVTRYSKRVAIIDIDLHHGNGTEEIIRYHLHSARGTPALFFGSIQYQDIFPWTSSKSLRSSAFSDYIVNVFLPSGAKAPQWRDSFSKKLLPPLQSFAPDLIIISAGFDAHAHDLLGSGKLDLLEEDYYWATKKLVEAASLTSAPIISVLEGGYDVPALCSSVTEHLKALTEGGVS